MQPITRQEQLLNSIATGDSVKLEPITREEQYLACLAGITDTKPERPITRKEMFYDSISKGGGGGGAKPEQEKSITITQNGTTEVTPDEGKTLSKVTVTASVVGGEVGKPYIDTSKMTNFDGFCKGDRLGDQIGYLDTSNGTAFGDMFASCTFTTHPPINTSKGQYFQRMYRYCSRIATIPPLDTANGENFNDTFYGCGSLETVSITTAKKDFSTSTFQGCTKLKNITIGEGWAVNIYLHYSQQLTIESLHGMIENLADLTGQTAKTFQVGATNLAKIDEAHINMLQAKNWNYS